MKDDLAKAFLSTESFRWSPDTGFTLASGEVSPYYVDCRNLLSHPEPRHMVATLAYDVIKGLPLDCIGGLEIGAIPLATAISSFGFLATPQQTWRTFVVRKQPKGHGLGKLLEGAIGNGDRALIVDDVLTSGGSLLRAVKAARDAGLQVQHAFVVVDREEQNGRARVEAEGLTLHRLFTVQDLMQVIRTDGTSAS